MIVRMFHPFAALLLAFTALANPVAHAEQVDGTIVVIFAMVSGNGTGTVTSSPAGISCPGACFHGFTAGSALRLTATPQSSGYVFTRWTGGPCLNSTNSVCEFTVTTSTTASAEFMTVQYVNMLFDGNGSGRVTSVPAGVDCTSNCFGGFAYGTTITLTAAASAGSSFDGWGLPPQVAGDCTGSLPNCTILMDMARMARPRFTLLPPPTYRLDIFLAGNAQGTVTGNPGGINCPGVCAGNYAAGTMVNLQAAALPGSTFTNWSGSCAGTSSTCQVTMDMARSVFAHFATTPMALNVFINGSGSGRVATVPSGIDCPGTCSTTFPSGTQVIVLAQANPGSVFTGWQGTCASFGTGDCTLTLNQPFTVIGDFEIDTDTVFVSGFD
jgi:hypothetical protein